MIKSPIKWAGGKTRVMPQLLKHLPKADCLIEPFVGSGTVFMNMEYRRYVLCDSNRALINFFLVLRDDTERLIAVARNIFRDGNKADKYYSEREKFNYMSWYESEKDCRSTLWAASFLYLNRHCFNGLYRTNLDGGFNVPFGRYKQPYLPEAEMRLFAEKARDTNALFLCNDFRTSIPYIAKNRPDSVIYCDPPLYPGQQNRQLHRLRQAVYPGRSSRSGCNPARCSSPAWRPLGYLKQRHPGNPRDLFRFQPPCFQRPPFRECQKPRYGWRGYWRSSRVRLLWPFWWRQLPRLWPCDG